MGESINGLIVDVSFSPNRQRFIGRDTKQPCSPLVRVGQMSLFDQSSKCRLKGVSRELLITEDSLEIDSQTLRVFDIQTGDFGRIDLPVVRCSQPFSSRVGVSLATKLLCMKTRGMPELFCQKQKNFIEMKRRRPRFSRDNGPFHLDRAPVLATSHAVTLFEK